MPFSSGPVVRAPNFQRPKVLVTRAQWTVLGMLLIALALEFTFSPYWHPWIRENLVQGAGKAQQILIQPEGFIVIAFLLFATAMILLLTGLNDRAGYAIAGLLLLWAVLVRAQPLIDWLDLTTQTLKKASGA